MRIKTQTTTLEVTYDNSGKGTVSISRFVDDYLASQSDLTPDSARLMASQLTSCALAAETPED